MKRSFLLVFVALWMWAGGDPAKGKTYYQTCVACHGANGEGMKTLNSPNLTHLPEWYILSQLKNFKDGIRGTDPKDLYGMQMRPMAMTLPDEKAMLDVIAYIKTLKPGSVEHTESGDAAKGKSLYATCTACHGAKGEGNEALHAPSFEGQADWYMIRQLQNFKAGIRGANPKDMWGQQMRPMAMTLPDDKAIKDVVAYIKTLK